MEDRFRYRVWDKTKNGWLHFDFSTYPTYQDRIWQALTDGETFYQCTGLKDKNGKLIYEGDIVFYKIGSNKCRDVVKWSDDRCSWVKGYQDLCTYKKYCEVIGNIYENPELIGGADKCI